MLNALLTEIVKEEFALKKIHVWNVKKIKTVLEIKMDKSVLKTSVWNVEKIQIVKEIKMEKSALLIMFV